MIRENERDELIERADEVQFRIEGIYEQVNACGAAGNRLDPELP